MPQAEMQERGNAGDSFHDFVSTIRTKSVGIWVESDDNGNAPQRDISQLSTGGLKLGFMGESQAREHLEEMTKVRLQRHLREQVSLKVASTGSLN